MNINWYPGHMHKARKQIRDALPDIDVIIEVVDARLPYSSQNPIIVSARSHKPTIIILNKSDLADAAVTQQWRLHFESNDNVRTLAFDKSQRQALSIITHLCHKLVPHKTKRVKDIQAMILGIPNVGKSTLINLLAGRSIAKVGNQPAVTRNQQRIAINGNIVLHDTPGMLWPKIKNSHSGYRLAITGAIKDTAIDYEDIGFYAADYFIQYYPWALVERFAIDKPSGSALNLLETIGEKRGAVGNRGRLNLHKVCESLIHEYRSGKLGSISLETPAMINAELQQLALQVALQDQVAADKNRGRSSNG
jgi:ribosome biogenesis GTPase A